MGSERTDLHAVSRLTIPVHLRRPSAEDRLYQRYRGRVPVITAQMSLFPLVNNVQMNPFPLVQVSVWVRVHVHR